MVIRFTRQKSRCQKGHAPSRGSREGFVLASFRFLWLPALHGLWSHPPISASIAMLPASLLSEISVISLLTDTFDFV